MANETVQRKEINDYYADQYRQHAPRIGLDSNWLGQTFTVGPQTLRVEGFLPDEPIKSCVLVRDAEKGTAYKCSAVQIATKMRGAFLKAS